MTDLYVKRIEQRDPRLGRNVLHDPRSRAFALNPTVDKSTWHDKAIRFYDPIPNPDQPVGNCTTCAKCMQFNAVGNRRKGVVLGMATALDWYRVETRLDPFPGSWEPDDTGSNGLSSCKMAQQLGEGGTYRFLFGGADEIVQAIMAGQAISVGTVWDYDMFHPDKDGVIRPGGGQAGGHQYVARRYWRDRDLVGIRCWWGPGFRDVWIKRPSLDALVLNDGDGHWQARA